MGLKLMTSPFTLFLRRRCHLVDKTISSQVSDSQKLVSNILLKSLWHMSGLQFNTADNYFLIIFYFSWTIFILQIDNLLENPIWSVFLWCVSQRERASFKNTQDKNINFRDKSTYLTLQSFDEAIKRVFVTWISHHSRFHLEHNKHGIQANIDWLAHP